MSPRLRASRRRPPPEPVRNPRCYAARLLGLFRVNIFFTGLRILVSRLCLPYLCRITA